MEGVFLRGRFAARIKDQMKMISHSYTAPAFNLASEEYLLKTAQDDICMLWRNSPSVIIGRYQNAYAEIDQEFVRENDICVVRRLTGGGAVFHDLGNLNFTFITDGKRNALDFERFTEPIVRALRALGLEVSLSGRNDLTINGLKFSGNAQCVYPVGEGAAVRYKTMHHGTLLLNADLSRLAGALRTDPEKIRSKGISSVRSRVANLAPYMKFTMNAEEFQKYLEDSIGAYFGAQPIEWTADDRKGIQELADKKYSTWEWNFGESKQYAIQRKRRFPFGTLEIQMEADKGCLTELRFFGDFFGSEEPEKLAAVLKGTRLHAEELTQALSAAGGAGRFIAGAENAEIVSLLL